MNQCCENNDAMAVFAYTLFLVIISLWVVFHIPYMDIVTMSCIMMCIFGDLFILLGIIEYKEKKENRCSWQLTTSIGFLYMLFLSIHGHFIWGFILCVSYVIRSINSKKFWEEQDRLFNKRCLK